MPHRRSYCLWLLPRLGGVCVCPDAISRGLRLLHAALLRRLIPQARVQLWVGLALRTRNSSAAPWTWHLLVWCSARATMVAVLNQDRRTLAMTELGWNEKSQKQQREAIRSPHHWALCMSHKDRRYLAVSSFVLCILSFCS